MKNALLAAAGCAAAAMAALAAQNRPSEFPRPVNPVVAALDLNHDGSLTGDEVQASASSLKALDRNGDGQLTTDEVRPDFGGGRRGRGGEGERGRTGSGTAPDDLAETLMTFDHNSDGRLVRSEVPERFQGLFDRADGDTDGALSKEELTRRRPRPKAAAVGVAASLAAAAARSIHCCARSIAMPTASSARQRLLERPRH